VKKILNIYIPETAIESTADFKTASIKHIPTKNIDAIPDWGDNKANNILDIEEILVFSGIDPNDDNRIGLMTNPPIREDFNGWNSSDRLHINIEFLKNLDVLIAVDDKIIIGNEDYKEVMKFLVAYNLLRFEVDPQDYQKSLLLKQDYEEAIRDIRRVKKSNLSRNNYTIPVRSY